MYENGYGVKQDEREAVKYCKIAANQGDAEAQYFLGMIYQKGDVVKQSFTEAKKYYSDACNNGNQGGCDGYKNLNLKGY